MPIDRHTSGDEFDRNEDARVKDQDQPRDDGRVTVPAAATTDRTAGGDRPKAGTKAASKAGGSAAPARRRAARKTARNRPGRTARSKEATLKEMAQRRLVRDGSVGAAVTARDKAARRVSKQASERAEGKALEALLKSRPAGQGILWSLLAAGLAACGGGTNTIRVAGEAVPGDTTLVPSDRPGDQAPPSTDIISGQRPGDRSGDQAPSGDSVSVAELAQTRETLSETQTALSNLLGTHGRVSKGLPRGAKIYLLDQNGARDGEHIAETVKIIAHTYGFFTFEWDHDNDPQDSADPIKWNWTYTLADSVEWSGLTAQQKAAFTPPGGTEIDGESAYAAARTALDAITAPANTVTLAATVTDGSNASTETADRTFTITPSNDHLRTKTVAGVGDGKLINDIPGKNVGTALLTQAIDLNDHFEDVDTGDTVTYTITGVSRRDGTRLIGIDPTPWTSLLPNAATPQGTTLVSSFTVPGVAAGTYVLTITATSSDTSTQTKTLQVTVNDAAPTRQGGAVESISTALDPGGTHTTASLDTFFNDLNGDSTLTYSVLSGAGFSINAQRALTGTIPAGTAAGTYDVVVRATDSNNQTIDTTFRFTVNDVAPTRQGGAVESISTAVDPGGIYTTGSLDTYFNDMNGDSTLTYSVQSGDGFSITAHRQLTGTVPPTTAAGNYDVVVRATDSSDQSVDITFRLTINAAPTFDHTHDGTGNTTRDILRGEAGSNLFKVDNDYGGVETADVIETFFHVEGDRIDLPDSDFPSGTTVYYQRLNVLTDDDENEVVLYKDQAKTEAIAVIDVEDYVPQAGDFLDAGIVVLEIT